MKIYIAKIHGCDFCGSSDLPEHQMVCDRCLMKIKPREERERKEAIAAFISNHPRQELPDCFLPKTIWVEDGGCLLTLSEDKQTYFNNNLVWKAADLIFANPMQGFLKTTSTKFDVEVTL
ncbi:hypothetical protein FD723_39780 (plasmid) [Nostoc sp. C052]|uniref:hypothetical protein n=1 Tax=Nostoc sp. C052 TaxID=2576902 RepID=UPI0015C341DE|nr:hypothetical protein [Nostoc sp. C052]QLE46353.1 hypothetical protein FD723_39780 [Nostoc sp. C052]